MPGPGRTDDTTDRRPQTCLAETTLAFLSGKWRPMIVYWLLQGTRRFNQLQRELGGVTHRTLSKTLKEMEADGLVVRTDHGEIPPRVDYALTRKGKSLAPVLAAMERWALTSQASRGRDGAPAVEQRTPQVSSQTR